MAKQLPMAQPALRTTRIRRVVQMAWLALFFLAPWLDILRADVLAMRIYLFGHQLAFGQTIYFLLFGLSVMTALVFLSFTIGRVFCGWSCPQGTLSEWVDRVIKWIGPPFIQTKRIPPLHKRIAGWATLIGTAVAAGFTTVAYAVPPRYIVEQLVTGHASTTLLGALAFVTTLAFANIVLIRHSFCSGACPYGMLQQLLGTEKTMQVVFREPFPDNACIHCNACVRACFMNINPMSGDLQHCVQCGDCITACEKVMGRLNKQRILWWEYGKGGKSTARAAFLDVRPIAVGIAFVVLISTSFYGVLAKTGADFTVTRLSAGYLLKEGDKTVGNKFAVILTLTEGNPQMFHISQEGLPASTKIEPADIAFVPGLVEPQEVTVKAPGDLAPGPHKVTIVATNTANPKEVYRSEVVYFVGGGDDGGHKEKDHDGKEHDGKEQSGAQAAR